jgi:hypothetical protein
VREVLANLWTGANWISAERIGALRDLGGGDVDAIAEVLALHPAFPPGVQAGLERAGDRELTLRVDGPRELLDAEAPGWLGLVGAGDARPVEAIAQAVNPRARVVAAGPRAFTIALDPAAEPVQEPPCVSATRISTVAAWRFRDFA